MESPPPQKRVACGVEYPAVGEFEVPQMNSSSTCLNFSGSVFFDPFLADQMVIPAPFSPVEQALEGEYGDGMPEEYVYEVEEEQCEPMPEARVGFPVPHCENHEHSVCISMINVQAMIECMYGREFRIESAEDFYQVFMGKRPETPIQLNHRDFVSFFNKFTDEGLSPTLTGIYIMFHTAYADKKYREIEEYKMSVVDLCENFRDAYLTQKADKNKLLYFNNVKIKRKDKTQQMRNKEAVQTLMALAKFKEFRAIFPEALIQAPCTKKDGKWELMLFPAFDRAIGLVARRQKHTDKYPEMVNLMNFNVISDASVPSVEIRHMLDAPVEGITIPEDIRHSDQLELPTLCKILDEMFKEFDRKKESAA